MEKNDASRQDPHQKVTDTISSPETKKGLTGSESTAPQEGRARGQRTAYDIKELHGRMDLDKETLKKIPIVDAGERLHQGSTYFDLNQSGSEPFTATSEQKAGENQWLVRKSDVAYEIWNHLAGEEKPDEEFEESPNYSTHG